ncbi:MULTISPECIES: hypothetical protein [Streptomyces]|uniref:Uncharacterized protein n=1 Tax=Streptomyces virginiae TaxID=1961 RepID=A0ABQ3NK64_STRVG|nr:MULTISPECIES: hypothetical protein [Streptomyces]KOU98853.1 hypothetical protein ADK91_29560 [Streptomyces sp. XY511]MBP2342943.1 hypothetical protein [Streptomyces virginiae]MCI4080368.1 hypothetical protein [Streptomyces sp. MMS21 TC-5]GGQ42416.1 hypothetical protein GCM10010215_77370 [Streptomyces virginiae]GHI13169.1 hypothetical protein Scinn_26320 [Streptomyces virginiae]
MPADRPVALDEYPIHQAPLSMKHLVSGDRNAYDRCIFHVFDHAGRAVLILGLGVYPNAGVIDAYATLRIGDELLAVRASDALTDDRMNLSVGPLSIVVDVPLKQLTLRCAPDADDPHGLSYDITWTAEFPAVWEPHHIQRRGDRLMLEGRRFVQAGNVTGTIRAKGEEFTLTAGEWTGTRDRSWGVRPIPGEEGGRAAEEYRPDGFHWLWIPVRFADRFVMVIAQEDADGHRTLNEAVQVFPEAGGRADVQLGWPHTEIRYRPGSRHPESAVVHLTDPSRKPLELGVEILNSSPLAVGAGYPPAGDWQHGTWQGRGWSDRRVYDLSHPAAHPMAAFGVTDHSARFTLDGQTGHGIFEHGSFGRHDPSGFADYSSVAP